MDRKQRAADLVRIWTLGLTEAIKSRTAKQAAVDISESNREAAESAGPLEIIQHTFNAGPGALLWSAAGAEVVASITESGQADGGWQRLCDEAVQRVCAAGERPGNIPAGETVAAIPGETGAVFAIQLTIAGDTLPTVFWGASTALLDAADAGRAVATAAAEPVRPTLDLLLDVELPLSISFGRTYLPVREILKLSTGSIVELNCPANEYVDVIVNNCTIARGEVVVVEGNYGVRIDEIISRRERLQLQHRNGLNPARPMRINQ